MFPPLTSFTAGASSPPQGHAEPWPRGVIPRWISHLSALRPDRSAEDWHAFFDWAGAAGFYGTRVFAGALTWCGQTPASALARLPQYLDLADRWAMSVEVVAITDAATGYDIEAHVAAIAAILRSRRRVFLELANEPFHGAQGHLDFDRLRAIGAAHAGGLVWAVGAPDVDEPIQGSYPGSGGSYQVAHLDRSRDMWNNVRRVRELYAVVEATGRPCLNNEPMGADELDGSATGRQRWNDSAAFAALGALNRAFGCGGVHHAQHGLHAERPGPIQHDCAKAHIRAWNAVDAALGGAAGRYRNAGWAGPDVPVGALAEGGPITRAYSFLGRTDHEGCTVLVGAEPAAFVPWANGWRPVSSVAFPGHGRGCAVVTIQR